MNAFSGEAGRLRPAFSARRQSGAAARGLRSRRSNRSGGYPKILYDDDDHKKALPFVGAQFHFESFFVIFGHFQSNVSFETDFGRV